MLFLYAQKAIDVKDVQKRIAIAKNAKKRDTNEKTFVNDEQRTLLTIGLCR